MTSDPGAADARPYDRRPTFWVLAILALGVVATAGYLGYASGANVEVAGLGYAVEPAGRVVAQDEGAVIAYPGGEVARLRLRVPVRNTSRLPLTVRYALDAGYAFEEQPSDYRTVLVEPGATAWLEYAHTDRGCASGPGDGHATQQVQSVRVWVTAPGMGEREEYLALPVPYEIPAFAFASTCVPGAP